MKAEPVVQVDGKEEPWTGRSSPSTELLIRSWGEFAEKQPTHAMKVTSTEPDSSSGEAPSNQVDS